MLDQDAEKALDGTEQRAWTIKAGVWRRLRRRIAGRSALEIEVELHSGELPRASDGVDELDVDFRP